MPLKRCGMISPSAEGECSAYASPPICSTPSYRFLKHYFVVFSYSASRQHTAGPSSLYPPESHLLATRDFIIDSMFITSRYQNIIDFIARFLAKWYFKLATSVAMRIWGMHGVEKFRRVPGWGSYPTMRDSGPGRRWNQPRKTAQNGRLTQFLTSKSVGYS